MPKCSYLVALVVLTLSLFSLPLLAQQSPPSADTFVSSTTPNMNYGSSIIDVVGSDTTTYMRFNLSGVPSGATVSKATLRLYVDAVATGGQFDVYNLPATPAWSESTLKYNTPPPPLGTSATGGHPVTVSGPSANTFILIDITATVQGWLNTPSSNNGVALALVGTTGLFSFDSKEGIITSHEPELEIVWNGAAGAQGPQGPPGLQGPAGSPGAQGPIGNTGPQGAQGPKGDTGATGAQGPMGNTGPQGLQGTVGPQGPIGPPGIDGTVGAQGPIGPVGAPGLNARGPWSNTASPQYALNDVTTDQGQTWRCANPQGGANNNTNCTQEPSTNNSRPAGEWELLAAKGTDGAPGAAGPTGPAGTQGVPGLIGPAGIAGNLALAGMACPTGSQVTGFDATGNLVCATGSGRLPSPTISTAPNATVGLVTATLLGQPNYLWNCSITGGVLDQGNAGTLNAVGAQGLSVQLPPGQLTYPVPVALACNQTDSSGNSSLYATATINVYAFPTMPFIGIQPQQPVAGSVGVAFVLNTVAGMTYSWTIVNGTITNSAGNSIAYSVGSGGLELIITCTPINGAGLAGVPGTILAPIQY